MSPELLGFVLLGVFFYAIFAGFPIIRLAVIKGAGHEETASKVARETSLSVEIEED